MSRQEDFIEASQSLEVQVISNPWTLFEKGCEYGYQYAIDKACEWLKNHSETDYYELIPNANYCGAVKLNKNKMIEDLCKAMEE